MQELYLAILAELRLMVDDAATPGPEAREE
jgi:hypothetical protein